MRSLHKVQVLALAALATVACSRRELSDGWGYLAVSLGTDTSSELVVKAAQEPAADEVFSLRVVSKKTGMETLVEDYRSLTEEPLKLASGDYTVTAFCGTPADAAWDAPYYEGSTDITIKPDKENVADITCRLANTMVTVEFAEDTDLYFPEYSVSIANDNLNALIFHKSATVNNLGKTAYFAATGSLRWTLNLTNTDGVEYTTRGTLSGVEARQHYHLTFKVEEAPEAVGGLYLRIKVDDSMNESMYPLTLDFDNEGLPFTTADFEITNEISVPKGSATPMNLYFTAGKGIKSLIVSHSDAALTAAGLPASTELMDASAADIEALAAAGIQTDAVSFGETTATLEFSTLVAGLEIGNYSFTTTVVDAKDHADQKTFNISVISPVDAEAVSVVSYAQFAIVKAKWFASTRPDGLGFQYRKASESIWTDFTGDITFDDSAKRYSAEIYSLAPETEYVMRAVSTKDKDTKEISFTTDAAPTIHNLSFDSWYQSGSAWMPNAEGYSVWDSANPGTASLGVVPTTPEESDVVSGKAARLQSSTAFGQFAAGNIYLGQFNKVSGLGAILNWGVPFTGRPIALKGHYKYAPKTIDKAQSPYSDLKGQTDNCSIRIWLTDWTSQFTVNTSQKKFLEDDDESIIASGSLFSSNTDSGYVEFIIPIQYRRNETPKMIEIACAASRYGDYFTGGVGSVLLVDEFEFVYNPAELTETQRELVGYRQ